MSELIRETIETCIEYIPKLIAGAGRATTLFRGQDASAGMELILPVFDGLEWVMTAIAKTDGAGGESGIDIGELSKHFIELTDALEKQDTTLTADLFEFEVIPVLQSWQKKLIAAHQGA